MKQYKDLTDELNEAKFKNGDEVVIINNLGFDEKYANSTAKVTKVGRGKKSGLYVIELPDKQRMTAAEDEIELKP